MKLKTALFNELTIRTVKIIKNTTDRKFAVRLMRKLTELMIEYDNEYGISGDLMEYFYAKMDAAMVEAELKDGAKSDAFGCHKTKRYRGIFNQ